MTPTHNTPPTANSSENIIQTLKHLGFEFHINQKVCNLTYF